MRTHASTFLLTILTALCLQHVSDLSAAVMIPRDFRSLLQTAEKPGIYEDSDHAGIYNSHTGVLFEKKTGNLLGIWNRDGWTAASNIDSNGTAISALWQVGIMLPQDEKPLLADSGAFAPSSIEVAFDEAAATITLSWKDVRIGEYGFAVEARVRLDAGSPEVRWEISVPGEKKNPFSIWSVFYPIVAVPAFDSGDNNRVVIPYRRGVLSYYGSDQPASAIPLPYPGPGAKFQFMAPYGDVSRKGLYYACKDGEGYSKIFHYANKPRAGAIVLKTEHLPANRGLPGTGFQSPYEMVTRPFEGDWWTAARIYRDWWVNQKWASQGLLQDRKDVPDWIKKAPVAVRFSTSKPGRTIEANVAAGTAISVFLDKRPFFGIWYGAFGEKVGRLEEGLIKTGHGHTLPVSPEVSAALATMREHNVSFLAYIQSIIYDSKFPGISDEDVRQAEANASRDRQGRITHYGAETAENGLIVMNRGTEWWQQRLTEQSVIAVKNGFRGIYLDSFGKGETENFAPFPGQSAGGGNQAIEGQRKMAQRITAAIREIDPEAVLSGEDPVEAFRDVVQVNLYAVNLYENYIPIYRTVWGDYSLGYGRTIRMSDDPQENVPEMGRLFIDGNILGRFFCSSGAALWKNPAARSVEKRYIEKAVNFTSHGIDYLRFGEYLRPLRLDVPSVEFVEGVEKNKITTPAVLNSVTRSHRDGTHALVFTNVSARPVAFDFSLETDDAKNLPGELHQMDEQGNLTKFAKASGRHSVTIEPYEILFYILK